MQAPETAGQLVLSNPIENTCQATQGGIWGTLAIRHKSRRLLACHCRTRQIQLANFSAYFNGQKHAKESYVLPLPSSHFVPMPLPVFRRRHPCLFNKISGTPAEASTPSPAPYNV